MSTVDVIKSSRESIHQISEHLEGATVYLDAGCTESFQFLGAVPLLLEHGVRAICCLESMSSLETVADWNGSTDVANKVVVMTSCLLSDTHRYILRCLNSHPSLRYCYIFTSIAEGAHSAYPDSPLGPDAYREYEALLIQDYEELTNKQKKTLDQLDGKNFPENSASEEEGWAELEERDISHVVTSPSSASVHHRQQKLVVSVQHFPMIFCPLSPRVFVLPSGGSVAQAALSVGHKDSLSPGLPPLSTGVIFDSEDAIPGAPLTAHFLHYLACKMDLKLEIFSFGDMSKVVGRMLTDMSSLYDVGRRKRSASLLLIDRTLDLLTPCCHGDSLFDRIFSALPHRDRSPIPPPARSSQDHAKPSLSRLQRTPLDVRVPLDVIFNEDSRDNFRLLEGIEAIVRGWDFNNSASKIQDLIDLSSKIQDDNGFDDVKHLLDGSFIATENFRGTPYLEAVLDRRMKDGAVLVKKWLQETLRKENISVNVKARPGSASKSELQALVKALAKNDPTILRNKGIIQLTAALLAALDELNCDKWDAFISAEKMLHVCAGDTSQSLSAQINDLINKSILDGSQGGKPNSSQGLISFKDALLLTIVGYILAGENFPTTGSTSPFSWQEEHLLKEAIVDAIFENPALAKLKFVDSLAEQLTEYRAKVSSEDKKPTEEISIDDFDDDQWGKWGDEDVESPSNQEQTYNDIQVKLELRDKVDNLFRFLHKLSSLKNRNAPVKEGPFGSDFGIGGDSFESKGLLYKLLVEALAKHDIAGLEHHSSAVGRLFKSGFGRFGLGQAKPSLADQNVILVFVIGGINGLEVREAFEALCESGRPDLQLLVGGTTLLSPDDMFELLLGNSSYF